MWIYLVDDDSAILSVLRLLIEDGGLGTVAGCAKDARDALEDLSSSRAEIVLVDLLMPGMDGISFVREAKKRFPELRFVMLSQVTSKDMVGIEFLGEVGTMAGVAAAILVPIAMGANPVFAVIGGVAVGGYGILPGFLAGYAMGFLAPLAEKYLPNGLDTIIGAFLLAPIARLIAFLVDPAVNTALTSIGAVITAATEQSPIVMGFLLGGILKIICTSPLSSMALTAMLGLTGLPMGIAAIACFGGAFSNGILFAKLKLGDRSSVIAVMLEPLTQAHIITRYPIPVYASSFIGGALSGIPAALLGIIDNAPGTASPIPGLLAPFAFNPTGKVLLALALSVVMGCLGGLIGAMLFKRFTVEKEAETGAVLPQAVAASEA